MKFSDILVNWYFVIVMFILYDMFNYIMYNYIRRFVL